MSGAGSADHAAVDEATRRIALAVRQGVAGIRGAEAPEEIRDSEDRGGAVVGA